MTTVPQPRPTQGQRIKVGDLLYVAGRSHRVARLTRHFHPTLGQYRIAHCEADWRIAVYPHDYIDCYR